MRVLRTVLAVVFSLVLMVTGCSRQITGTAQVDPNQPQASITMTDTASVRDPKTRRCRSSFTPNRSAATAPTYKPTSENRSPTDIGIGALAVTYRPVTFSIRCPTVTSARRQRDVGGRGARWRRGHGWHAGPGVPALRRRPVGTSGARRRRPVQRRGGRHGEEGRHPRQPRSM